MKSFFDICLDLKFYYYFYFFFVVCLLLIEKREVYKFRKERLRMLLEKRKERTIENKFKKQVI